MAGIYLHIPFCRQACTYCNFHFSTSLARRSEMVAALMQEATLRAGELEGQAVETVYIGGGTPSLLPVDDLQRIFDTLHRHLDIGSLKECTLEANPDDLTRDYLRALRMTPVSRFSIGVQSFRDEDLRYMNRAHNAGQADAAIKAAQDAGFENLSVDLIYGTPGLTDAAWSTNLETIRTLQVPHLSAYALTVEEGTALHHAIAKKSAAPVDAEQSAGQAEILMAWAATAGYDHYEISNLARPGCYAVHNTAYWQGVPYLGIGPSAHSFDGRRIRRWNVANNSRYLQGVLAEGVVPHEQEALTDEERFNEYVMTALRTMWGVDLTRVAAGWGEAAAESLRERAARFVAAGQVTQTGKALILTPAGRLLADGIAADLFL